MANDITDALYIEDQLPNGLPPATVTITTHNSETSKSIFYEAPNTSQLRSWHPSSSEHMTFFSLYHTTTSPASLNGDIETHETTISENFIEGLPLSMATGTISRMVDLAPGYATSVHRTHSIDYGVVVEGSVELELDSGQVRRIERGGMVVQRGTMHLWRNASKTSWARVFFVLVAAEPVMIGGKALDEDYGGL